MSEQNEIDAILSTVGSDNQPLKGDGYGLSQINNEKSQTKNVAPVVNEIIKKKNLKKNPVGRPPKKKDDRAKDLIKGVVDTPEDPKNRVEIRYGNYETLKKFFSLLKKSHIEEAINICIFPKEIHFQSLSKTNQNKHLAVIDCTKIMSFYADIRDGIRSINFSIKPADIIKVIGAIDNCNSVLFKIPKEGARDKIIIEYDCTLDGFTSTYDSKINTFPFDEDLNSSYDIKEFNTDPALLSFTYSSKLLKRDIANIKKTNKKTFNIQKLSPKSNIKFVYNSSQATVKSEITVKETTKLNLESKLKPQNIFIITISNEKIKSASDNIFSDTLRIHCHNEKPLILESKMDNDAFCMKILVPIEIIG